MDWGKELLDMRQRSQSSSWKGNHISVTLWVSKPGLGDRIYMDTRKVLGSSL